MVPCEAIWIRGWLPHRVGGMFVLGLYVAAMILSGSLLPTLAFVITAMPLTAAVIFVSYLKSDGEWRYRNGE